MVNGYAGYTVSERKFRKWRKSTQITAFVIPNTSSCHSERSEESHPGKERRFFAYALNDKEPNANFANVVPAGEHKVRLYAAFRPVA